MATSVIKENFMGVFTDPHFMEHQTGNQHQEECRKSTSNVISMTHCSDNEDEQHNSATDTIITPS